jgi:hypothetical protein
MRFARHRYELHARHADPALTRGRSVSRFRSFLLVPAVLYVSHATAQQGAWMYDIFVEECLKASGRPGSTREQFLRGEKFNCIRGGSGASAEGPSGACAFGEAKTAVDWVFSDRGAQRTYASALADGKSGFDAVLTAQGHNPRAQAALRNCASQIEAYLQNRGKARPATMSSRKLGPQDCTCVSIVPAAGGPRQFQVTNRCDAMKISVLFGGDTLQFSPDPGSFSGWAAAGIVSAETQSVIQAPEHWTVVTIEAYELKNAATHFTCRTD